MKSNWRAFVAGAVVVLLIVALKIYLPPIGHSANVNSNASDVKVEYFTLTVDFDLPFEKAVEETGIKAGGINPCITEENFPNQRIGKVDLQCAKFLFKGSVGSREATRKIGEQIKGERYSLADSRAILAFARDYDISELSYVISLGDGFFDESSRFYRSVMLWKNKCTGRKSLGLFTQSHPDRDLTEYWFLAVKD